MSGPGRIIILGAGPTGLGAAHRLTELGYDRYDLYEQKVHAGGLSASFIDEKGFVWDIGGHVLFSHYSYFDALMDTLIPHKCWIFHERESWIWVKGRFVPYPFQNNIARLPSPDMTACLEGIEAADRQGAGRADNFRDWITATFGAGISDIFMLPYNRKVWAYPPERLSHTWIAERVSTPDIERIRRNIETGTDDTSWGPNNKFRFPLTGGTGGIWRALADTLPSDRLHMGMRVTGINLAVRTVRFSDGAVEGYDTLITTIPLKTLAGICDDMDGRVRTAIGSLLHSSVHVVGAGFKGKPPDKLRTKCWMYFPEPDCPFYRVTVFSNYSPNNVPEPGKYWSLMAEVSESPESPVDAAKVADDVLAGLRATELIGPDDVPVSVWHHREEYANPTPSIGRDDALEVALGYLEGRGVYSRGRFGAWKYEVSNMDHSLMQGVELVDALLTGGGEPTLYPPAEKTR